MHSTGENVQCRPVADTSTAVARAIRSTRSASQEHAIASWVGKIVAPGQNECPWMASSAVSSGMPSRVRAARSMARTMASGDACRIDPASLVDTMSSRSPWALSCSICPTFSGRVMRPSRSSTRTSTDSRGS